MKAKTKNTLVSIALIVAMLFSLVIFVPHKVHAAVDPEYDVTINEIYIGNVTLSKGNHLLIGDEYQTSGAPEENASGYAYYTEEGKLILNNFSYEGEGKTHIDDPNFYKCSIYTAGSLDIVLVGENTISNTADSSMWQCCSIYADGNVYIGGEGSVVLNAALATIVCKASLVINGGTVTLPSNSSAVSVAGDFVVNKGTVSMTLGEPIHAGSVILNKGTVTLRSKTSSPTTNVFVSSVPSLPANAEDYTLTVSRNADGSSPEEYDVEKFDEYEYFNFVYTAKEIINEISVSGIDFPEVGESSDDIVFTPASLTYGDEYQMISRLLQKYTGTEWVSYNESENLIEYGTLYRIKVTLAPNDGYDFSSEITDGDVSINDTAGDGAEIFSAGTVNYANIYIEFSYEAPVVDYGIYIAAKDGDDDIGVLITEENCDDVLGDGTVSYDPATKTLTLYEYHYEGAGYDPGDGGGYAIFGDIDDGEVLRLAIVGDNSITLTGDRTAGIGFFGDSTLAISGNGALDINAATYGICLQGTDALITIANSEITINVTGTPSVGIYSPKFLMTSGDIKITSSMLGITVIGEGDELSIEGGSVEISANPGMTFARADTEHASFVSRMPDFSGYYDLYEVLASVNADGTDAAKFDDAYIASYKYVKVRHIIDYGIAIADKDGDETIAVIVTEDNYNDVLGDGTVSYDPENDVLVLNGYHYEGEGIDCGYYCGIYVDTRDDMFNLRIIGDNSISVDSDNGVGIVIYGDGYKAIYSDNGDEDIDCSLDINAPMIGINALGNSMLYVGEGFSLSITCTETPSAGILADNIYIYNDNLVIDTPYIGIGVNDEYSTFDIDGGNIEIATSQAGYAFVYNGDEPGSFVTTLPHLDSEFKISVSENRDGSNPTDPEGDPTTWKYVSLKQIVNYYIDIAAKDEDETIYVTVTNVNCDDVLGDGTVSYDPETKTLTLNGYTYVGTGYGYGSEGRYCLSIYNEDEVTINLVGENTITLNEPDTNGTGIDIYNTDVTVTGDGSLSITTSSVGIYIMSSDTNDFIIEGGNITINSMCGIDGYYILLEGGSVEVNSVAEGIEKGQGMYADIFEMTGGSLKITSDGAGIVIWSGDGDVIIRDGAVEISVADAGCSFVIWDNVEDDYVPYPPDFSLYEGFCQFTGSVNSDGTGAVAYDSDNFDTYKYVRIRPVISYNLVIYKDTGDDAESYLITGDNCDDVFGDGTVSFDPETNTLTLNGYVYNSTDINPFIYCTDDIDELNILLVGENTVTSPNADAALVLKFAANVTIKGEGSLEITALSEGIDAADDEQNILEIAGGAITINAPCAIYCDNLIISGGSLTVNSTTDDRLLFDLISFEMTGGRLKVDCETAAIAVYGQTSPIVISGGSIEISTTLPGCIFMIYDNDADSFVPYIPDLSDYEGLYELVAGVNADGTDAGEYDADQLSTYRYFKLEEHVCAPTIVPEVSAGCTTTGKEAYYRCECGKCFEDENGETEIADIDTWGIIDELGHDYADATCTEPKTCKRTDCGATEGNALGHSFGTEWKTDGTNHWKECACGEKSEVAAHSGGTATCVAKAKCSVCNAEHGSLADHNYSEATCTAKAKCSVCNAETGELAAHKYSEATCTAKAKCSVCNAETGELAAHKYSEATCTAKAKCSVCNAETGELKAHSGGTATCTAKAKCSVCNTEYGELAEHKYSEATCTAKAKCSVCNAETGELAEHKDANSDGKCDACEYTMSTPTPDPDPNEPEDSKDGLGTGAIIGIAAGSTAVAGVGGFSLFWFVIKKKSLADLLAVFKKN
ncbi:MAG: hypothetical protein IJV68_01335 [Clostridia bacterium]|nr:hypothetical protein [Clostridia bacterium]